MSYRGEKAREASLTADRYIKEKFGVSEVSGAQFISLGKKTVAAGVCGLKFESPVISVLLNSDELYELWSQAAAKGESILIKYNGSAEVLSESGSIKADAKAVSEIEKIIRDAEEWGGKLNEKGELTVDPSTPVPGPHYYTNMLIGNRIGFDRPLQSTPKSAVDKLGGGCFRAHADTQVLATKWDYLPEENGFPANRQFYITEKGKKIFYSGTAKDANLKSVRTTFSQNRTEIAYELKDGLKVKRTIFIIPQKVNRPFSGTSNSGVIAQLSG